MTIVIDCIGDPCPLPLIKTERRLRKLNSGEQICLQIDHNCALNIIPEWARKKGFQVKVEKTPYLEWNIYIKKVQKKQVQEEVVLKEQKNQ
ncbi:TusA-related sulfurtransferase [Halanaerobium saccharolyticum]|uniref:TusA-related sulfurtransferase n=1 Tax=Halanaerobium saccharolyticum TaxID=43595 RepID=A0A4R7Z6S4_9FIRM|nr:sulfurtransferase TusA family protein [Halanaerobium saccharolyticum]RAK08624.1 TusA-related sulfurtransferase [Halanaerobium saccharolyticum]TDW07233.1 TusA-related sulfurtransferase [Halanaerobium saccharolyticum]TDX60176.1 TusA-related sulfurtransferase [Halanaerobium saccharolyticum]